MKMVGLPALMTHHGDTARVTYTAPGSAAVALTAIIGAETFEEKQLEDGTRKIRRLAIIISTDPTSSYGGVATPKIKATVSIDSVNWSVEAVDPLEGARVQLTCVRHESMEKTRPSYRREQHTRDNR